MLLEREKCLGSAVCCWSVMSAVPFPASFASAITGVTHRVLNHTVTWSSKSSQTLEPLQGVLSKG